MFSRGRRQRRQPFNSPHPRRGSRACWDKGTILQILHLPGTLPLPPTPPQMLPPWSRKSSKFQTSKKVAFSAKMDPLWESTGEPKSAKSVPNAYPERPFFPFQKMCQNMSLFLPSKPLKIKLPPRRELNSHCVALPPKSL